MQRHSISPEETQAFAAELLKAHPNVTLWVLKGNLAAGKTTFVKGLAQALGEDPKAVKSPTFTYLNEHEGFVHYDLYRLESVDAEMEEQILEHIHSGKRVLIEWPELILDWLPKPYLELSLEHSGDDERLISARLLAD